MELKNYFLGLLFTATFFLNVNAQTNVRAWNANGQVFVVWELSTQTALTYSIHMSANPVASTSSAILVGSVFEPEWKGARLTLANPNARWRIPSQTGGIYQLTATEGLFVYTPHDTMTRYFFVTKDGDTQLSSSNRTAATLFVSYDPVADPVQCHLQFSSTTGQGFPFSVFSMWVDGRNDPNDARPDFPVMANAAKNGAPHVFAVFEQQGGLPTGPSPAVVCLHGGGQQGSYWSYGPNSFHYGNTGNAPTDGITIAFDDRLFLSSNGVLNTDRPTNWFGWHTQMSATNASNAPANGLAVPYTLRRLLWSIDWLIHASNFSIDSNRVAIMGNSMGGTGTLLLSRWKPERFSAATAFVPPHYTPETAGRLFGTSQTNMKTTEVGPDGDTLRINDFFDPGKRISTFTRDYCLTRIYRGRCDDAAEWGPQHLQLFNELNDKGLGVHLYWDNRDHTASDWTTDTPGDSCPDIGQWVSPVRTEKCAVPYQSRFRSNQSYPGFFNDDQDLSAQGRQPVLGNGSPLDGDAWGTWGGYYEWDSGTLVDTADRWECTVYLTGQSPVSVDNYPGNNSSCDVSIRKPKQFQPAPGTNLQWRLINPQSGQVLQTGITQPDTAGLIVVTGLTIFKNPIKTRLIIESPFSTGQQHAEENRLHVVVYPNPANDELNLNGQFSSAWKYELNNAYGVTCASGTVTGRTIPLSSIANGTYTLVLTDEAGNRIIKKILVIR